MHWLVKTDTLWQQTQLDYTATWAGLVAAPSGVTAVLVAPFVGRYIGKYDPRAFAAVSFVIFAASYFMRAAYPPDASVWVFVVPLLVQGVAMGMFFKQCFRVDPHRHVHDKHWV
jgi:DHA2 family multidrug resistance protein